MFCSSSKPHAPVQLDSKYSEQRIFTGSLSNLSMNQRPGQKGGLEALGSQPLGIRDLGLVRLWTVEAMDLGRSLQAKEAGW